METFRITCVVGARPNFMKIGPILREMSGRPRFQPWLVHTGQHYSPEMSDALFSDLGIPKPDVHLGVGPGTQTQQTADIMRALETVFLERPADVVLVVGDVNSTMAASLVAAKLGIRIAHVEAGLRSGDRRMPEEINRLVTDALSDYLFASEPSGRRNLLAEGVPAERIFLVGNVMIDTLLAFRRRAAESGVLDRLQLVPKRYCLVTLHRPSNVDEPDRLRGLVNMLHQLSKKLPIVFPVHPRTRSRIEEAGFDTGGLLLTPPLGYLDFLRLTSDARLVLTDSGGVQEETTILSVPCLTLRENTERPITMEEGTNRLVGIEPEAIFQAALEALNAPMPNRPAPALWDGKASGRILDVLERQLSLS